MLSVVGGKTYFCFQPKNSVLFTKTSGRSWICNRQWLQVKGIDTHTVTKQQSLMVDGQSRSLEQG